MGGGVSSISHLKNPDTLLSKGDVRSIVADEFSDFKWNAAKKYGGKIKAGLFKTILEEEVGMRALLDQDDNADTIPQSGSGDHSNSTDDEGSDVVEAKVSMGTIVEIRVKAERWRLRTTGHRQEASITIKKKLRQLLGMDQRFYKNTLAPKHIFKIIDVDGDGAITIDEWALCLRRRLRVTTEEVLDVDLGKIFYAMASNDAFITLETFCAWWHKIDCSSPMVTSRQLSLPQMPCLTGDKVSKEVDKDVDDLALSVFKRLLSFHAQNFEEKDNRRQSFSDDFSDKDNNERMSLKLLNPWRLFKLFEPRKGTQIWFDDFLTFLRLKLEIPPQMASDQLVRQLFEKIDTNGSGTISMDNFALYVQKNAPYALSPQPVGRKLERPKTSGTFSDRQRSSLSMPNTRESASTSHRKKRHTIDDVLRPDYDEFDD